jgi:hypothetical protein
MESSRKKNTENEGKKLSNNKYKKMTHTIITKGIVFSAEKFH